MNYTLSYRDAAAHYLDIEFEADVKEVDTLLLQLPSWRPGRYELGNFAKNVQKFKVSDEDGNPLPVKKITKDCWEVETGKASMIKASYNYFAKDLNAGSTYLDPYQLYVNPVNCCIYIPDRLEQACKLKVNVPENYQLAGDLKVENDYFLFRDYDQLADTPFIASPDLQHGSYEVNGITFHLWFQGEVKPDFKRLIKDFKAFSREQLELFGGIDMEAYHFLFQITPNSMYHGVEHANSTVIALGPSYHIMNRKERYIDLLGICSHELFHAWNVKRIRPVEMWPYDFTKENYSRLGYLAEGATTWYGDLCLFRSGVITEKEFQKNIEDLLGKHFNNPGVRNLSVADSSFDTWLDGYSVGVPNRKASIYTEGALITLMLDVLIREATDSKASFDDVLQSFYHNYYQKGKAISEKDYRQVIEEVSGLDLTDFFADYVHGTDDYTEKLEACLQRLGYQVKKQPTEKQFESHLGFRYSNREVVSVFPGSPAARAGLTLDDKIISVNGISVEDELPEWLEYFKKDTLNMQVFTARQQVKEIQMEWSKELYYAQYKVELSQELSREQKKFRKAWARSSAR
jgi:predicted metalloprotease with PDZ domain